MAPLEDIPRESLSRSNPCVPHAAHVNDGYLVNSSTAVTISYWYASLCLPSTGILTLDYMISWLGKPIIFILDIIGIACLLWNTEMKIKSLLNILMNNGNCIVVTKTLPALCASRVTQEPPASFKQSKEFIFKGVYIWNGSYLTIGLLQRQIEKWSEPSCIHTLNDHLDQSSLHWI